MSGLKSYDRVASVYDMLSQIYSLGTIRKAKLAQLARMLPGERVIYLGAGAGEDAARAAARGMDVTCIDLSPAMLERVRKRLDRRKAAAELIEGDVMDHSRFGHYDAVVGNFFFNVFPEQTMPSVLAHATRLLKPQGRLFIADFAPPAGSFGARVFNRGYNRAAMLVFRLGGLVAWHPIYDYAPHLAALGFREVWRRDFPVFRAGPVMFRSLAWHKASAGP